jgi:hypothetical protein
MPSAQFGVGGNDEVTGMEGCLLPFPPVAMV